MIANGEALSSYIVRLAEANGARLVDLWRFLIPGAPLNRFGESLLVGNYIIDLWPSATLDMELLSCLSGVPVDELLLHTYDEYGQRVLPLSPDFRYTLKDIRHWFSYQDFYYCPICVRERESIMLSWRWQKSCQVHEVRLRDTCPACGRRLKYYSMWSRPLRCPRCGVPLSESAGNVAPTPAHGWGMDDGKPPLYRDPSLYPDFDALMKYTDDTEATGIGCAALRAALYREELWEWVDPPFERPLQVVQLLVGRPRSRC